MLHPLLTPLDRMLARQIVSAVGAENPVSIRELIAQIWPEAYGPSLSARAARAIKASVRRLRRAGIKIGSSRGSRKSPPGYYMIANSAELAATVAPMLRQALDELKTIEALTGKQYYVRELAGQMKLFAESDDRVIGKSGELEAR